MLCRGGRTLQWPAHSPRTVKSAHSNRLDWHPHDNSPSTPPSPPPSSQRSRSRAGTAAGRTAAPSSTAPQCRRPAATRQQDGREASECGSVAAQRELATDSSSSATVAGNSMGWRQQAAATAARAGTCSGSLQLTRMLRLGYCAWAGPSSNWCMVSSSTEDPGRISQPLPMLAPAQVRRNELPLEARRMVGGTCVSYRHSGSAHPWAVSAQPRTSQPPASLPPWAPMKMSARWAATMPVNKSVSSTWGRVEGTNMVVPGHVSLNHSSYYES